MKARKCWCEHTNHFDDEFGPQTKHDYGAVADGDKCNRYVGAICNDCANTCLAGYDNHIETPECGN